jgi:hypothetical protein
MIFFAEMKIESIFALALKGRLAQLVQSIWFTPRGSGVRIPHRPQHKTDHNCGRFLFLYSQTPMQDL